MRNNFALIFLLLLAFTAPYAYAAQLETINLSYSALVVSGAPFWIGHELKLFDREGLRSQLVYINAGPRAMAAILAGEVQVSLSGVNAIVSPFAQGSDPVALAGTVNTINVSLFARPEIRTPEDLRGKRIGITRFGGLTDVATVYALKRWNLQPAKDVAIIQIATRVRYLARSREIRSRAARCRRRLPFVPLSWATAS